MTTLDPRYKALIWGEKPPFWLDDSLDQPSGGRRFDSSTLDHPRPQSLFRPKVGEDSRDLLFVQTWIFLWQLTVWLHIHLIEAAVTRWKRL